MFNIDASRYDQIRPGCYDVDERIRDMNAGGQLAGLNFPNWTGFSGQVLNQGPDRDTNLVMIKAYNDWHIDERRAAHPGRFIPCGILPLFDVQEAAKEVHRLAEKGCHAVTFSENPAALNMPSIHSGEWDPLFAACCDTGTVICCHLGSSSRSAQTSVDAPAGVAMSLSSAGTVYTLIDLGVGHLLGALPDPEVLPHRGRHRLDPLFPLVVRARQRPPPGLDQPRLLEDRWAHPDLQRPHPGVLHQGDRGPGADRPLQPRERVLGVRLPALRRHVAERPRGAGEDARRVRRRRHQQDLPRERGTGALPVRPLRAPPQGAVHGRRRAAESPDVDVVTRVGRPADERDLESWNRIVNAGR